MFFSSLYFNSQLFKIFNIFSIFISNIHLFIYNMYKFNIFNEDKQTINIDMIYLLLTSII